MSILQMYTRKDLLLLQKYKDENFKKALVDGIICQVKSATVFAAMNGETAIRSVCPWASTAEQAEELEKEKKEILERLKEIFPDSLVIVESNRISFIIYDFWELVVRVSWV